MSQHSQPPSSTGLRVGDLLRSESVGGILLLVAAVLAVGFANCGLQGVYFGVRDSYLGGELFGLDLRLSLGHWAADGLLAVFFFLAGLELKQEFVAGALRRPARAILPVAAAFGGVARQIVCDNLKVGVTRPSRYEPGISRTYQEMAAYYGTTILPARPGKPRDKILWG